MVPQELVAALVSTYASPRGATPKLVVGRIPEDMPFEVPRPASARVVGALTRGSAGTLVFGVPDRPAEAVRSYRDLLRRAAWDDAGHSPGGFQPLDLAHSGTLCRGEKESVSATTAQRSERETFILVQYWKSDRGSPCDHARRESTSFPSLRAPMPILYPHRDVAILDASTGGNRNFMQANARLETRMQPAELVAHYAEQLRGEGWTARSEASGDDVAGQTWRTSDRSGKAWIGVLVAIAVPDSDQREVFFRVMPREVER